MTPRSRFCVAVGSLVLCAGALRAQVPAQTAAPQVASVAMILQQLESDRADQVSLAVSSLDRVDPLMVPPNELGAVMDVAARLAVLEKYSEADRWLGHFITGTYAPEFLSPLQAARTLVVLQSGNPERALELAKGYYGICALNETDVAVDLVCSCVEAVDRNKPQPLERSRAFKREQLEGVVAGATAKAGSAGGLLKGIKVSPSEYAGALTRGQWDSQNASDQGNQYRALRHWGLVLLLAGDPEKAQTTLQHAVEVASSEAEKAEATDYVARAIRATDGSVGRANEWVTSHHNAP